MSENRMKIIEREFYLKCWGLSRLNLASLDSPKNPVHNRLDVPQKLCLANTHDQFRQTPSDAPLCNFPKRLLDRADLVLSRGLDTPYRNMANANGNSFRAFP